jgi:hypothetical protein
MLLPPPGFRASSGLIKVPKVFSLDTSGSRSNPDQDSSESDTPIQPSHLGAKLVRNAPEENVDDADMARRGHVVDALGFNVSARLQPDIWSLESATRY